MTNMERLLFYAIYQLLFVEAVANGSETSANIGDAGLATQSVRLTAYQRLFEDLFVNQWREPYMRPMNSTDYGPTVVIIRPALYSIVMVNEAEESVTFSQWFMRHWTDPTLTWDSKDYDGIESIIINDKLLWKPDIVMYEQLSRVELGLTPFATVDSNGLISKSNTVTDTVHCQLDVGDFPYDQQNCSTTYVSWAHDGAHLVLKSKTGTRGVIDFYQNNTEWLLLNYTCKEVVIPYWELGSWYEVHCHIILQRKPGYYVLTLIVPCYIIVMVGTLGLFSPSFAQNQDREEKITMGLTALLTIAVILMMVSDLMPKNANDFPLIGKYILFEIVICVCATVTEALIMYCHSMVAFGYNVPSWLLTVTCLNHIKKQRNGTADSAHAEIYRFLRRQYRFPLEKFETGDTDNDELIVASLNRILANLQHLRSQLDEKNNESAKHYHWMRVCFRLDCFFMLFYLSLNTIITMAFFA